MSVYAVSSWKDNTTNLSQEIIRATLNENVTDSFMRLYTITENDMLEYRSESFPLAVDVLIKTSEIWLIEQWKTANIELIIQALEKEPEKSHRALLFTISHLLKSHNWARGGKVNGIDPQSLEIACIVTTEPSEYAVGMEIGKTARELLAGVVQRYVEEGGPG
jgi:hypothetical protein